MGLPVSDWEFWVVSAAALGAAAYLASRFLPGVARRLRGRKRGERGVSLTIDGKRARPARRG